MDRFNIFFEHSALWIIPAILLAGFFSWLLYKRTTTFSLNIKKILGGLRFVTLAILLLLLISPIIRQIINNYESPIIVFALDNSLSVKEGADSAAVIRDLEQLSNSLSDEYSIEIKTLNENNQELGNIKFNTLTTDLNQLFTNINNDYENRNLASVILISDGIYNQGLNPIYSNYSYPIYSLGVGDTTHYPDLGISQLRYNKLSYQGNKVPIMVDVAYDEFRSSNITVEIYKGSTRISTKVLSPSGEQGIINHLFYIDANEKGLQRYDVVVSSDVEEKNKTNNRKSAFIDIVEGKKKILVMAPFPHPDLKALDGAIANNENYEVVLYIPVLNKKNPTEIINQPYDLVIFHQLPQHQLSNDPVFSKFSKNETAKLWITGTEAELSLFNQLNSVLTIESVGNQTDLVTAYFSAGFNAFNLTQELKSILNEMPPVSVPFGNIQLSGNSRVFLHQQVGKVQTTKPLFVMQSNDEYRSGVFLGDGLWRWKLYEFNRHQSHDRFNELILKTVQYLSTREDKRRFRFYPIKNEFSEGEPIVFETEIYNELYEQVYGQRVQIDITTPEGSTRNYQFVTSENNTRYSISGLGTGIYSYTARTSFNESPMQISGEFAVNAIDIENTRLTADFNLLRELSDKSGGNFYSASELNELIQELNKNEYNDRIQSTEDYLPLINVEWVAILLLILISIEWIGRKYHGAY